MNLLDDYSDERHKAWCIYCGLGLGTKASNEDHVPSQVLLLEPQPIGLPVVTVCMECNESFSLDEEYFGAFLGSVIAGSADPALHTNPKVKRILARSDKLRNRIESSRSVVSEATGESRIVWNPERSRIERVIVKNARGHALYELGEPQLEMPSRVVFEPLDLMTADQRREFFEINLPAFWPEVGCRLMQRLLSGEDFADGWITVQEGMYRYAVEYGDGVKVKTVLHEYLATEVFWDSW
jgi:hypothetical protein